MISSERNVEMPSYGIVPRSHEDLGNSSGSFPHSNITTATGNYSRKAVIFKSLTNLIIVITGVTGIISQLPGLFDNLTGV